MVRERFEWIMEYCRESETNEGVFLNCRLCDDRFLNSDPFGMLEHLYQKHHILEINIPSKRNSLNEKFTIEITSIVVGICRKCETRVECALGQVFPLKSHWTMCHTDDETTNFFAKANGISSGQKILIKYEIKNIISAQCTYCDTPQHLEGLDSNTADVLDVLRRHWNTHRKHYIRANKKIIQRELQEKIEKEKLDVQVEMEKEDVYQKVGITTVERKLKVYENHKECEMLLKQYEIEGRRDSKTGEISSGKCRRCGRIFHFLNRNYLIRNHWEIYHGPKSDVYEDIIKIRQVRNLLKNYIIEDGTRAICCLDQCEFISDLETETDDKLMELLKHWNTATVPCIHITLCANIQQVQEQEKRLQESLSKMNAVKNVKGTSETFSKQLPKMQEGCASDISSISSDDEDVAGPSGIQNVTTQCSSTETSSSKRKREDSYKNSDSDN